jgi:hypothetical protein
LGEVVVAAAVGAKPRKSGVVVNGRRGRDSMADENGKGVIEDAVRLLRELDSTPPNQMTPLFYNTGTRNCA